MRHPSNSAADIDKFGAPFPDEGNPVGGYQSSTGEFVPLAIAADGSLVTSSSGGGGGGAVTIADGADVAEGATTDAAVTGDNPGTVSAKLRGENKIWADVWDSVNHWLKVSIQNTSIAVTGTFWQATQPVSGTVTATPAVVTVPLVGQAKIAVTGTRVQLGTNTLVNGVIITASPANAAAITVGGSSLTNTTDGTGNGYILQAGASVSFACANTNNLYVNGTAGDIVSFAGS